MPSWSSGLSNALNSIAVGQTTLPTSNPRFPGTTCGESLTTGRDLHCASFGHKLRKKPERRGDGTKNSSRGVGARFANAIDQTVQRNASTPLAFPLEHGEIRRALVRKFAFGIYFPVQVRDLVIHAVMHGRRHPRRWQSRR